MRKWEMEMRKWKCGNRSKGVGMPGPFYENALNFKRTHWKRGRRAYFLELPHQVSYAPAEADPEVE